MSYRNWTYIVISFITLPVILLAVLNYVIDPFSIFNSNILSFNYEINERFNKIRHLDKNHSQYDSYIMGSSRSGTTSPSLLEKHIPNSHFYNFTVSGCSQYDNELHLRYFLEKGYTIKNIYLQIDISDMYGFKPPAGNLNARHHPHVTHSSKSIYYLSYLSVLPIKRVIEKIKVNYFGGHKNYLRYDLTHSGRWYVDYLEEQIKADPEKYITDQPSFNQKHKRGSKGTKIIDNLNALKRIKELADKHHINIIAYVAPHNHNMMNTFDQESYLFYLEEISKITNYWDFSGYNSISLNNHNYYEHSHYRDIVAEMIIAKIFNNSSQYVPNDFGYYVTAKNVQLYLHEKKTMLAEHERLTIANL